MAHASHPTFAAEADPSVISALSQILGPDIRGAKGPDDLNRRLNLKGFQVRLGYLATAPHGKLICPLSAI